MEPISPETKRLAARGMQLQADAMRRSLRNATMDRYADAAESHQIKNSVLDTLLARQREWLLSFQIEGRLMPYASKERRRRANREWHRKQRDGQCEAVTRNGKRCVFVGQYDGLSGEVRCGIHAR